MKNLLNKYSAIVFGLVLLMPIVACATNQTLLMNESERLEANISQNVMNRIAVTNDRIVNVFGDEGLFATQADEETGQVFIKPTADNGLKPLSITLTTENGLTQDLQLNPVEGNASTIILKSLTKITQRSPQELLLPGFSENNVESQTNQWIAIMKQAVLGLLPENSGHITKSEKHLEGLQLNSRKTYQSGSFLVQVCLIKNVNDFSQELLEKTFYKPGDLAISLEKRVLAPKESGLLYILRHSDVK
jgi:type-F conjugative transfer system secretin TraK